MRTVKDENVRVLDRVGDVNPVEHGGGFVFQEGDGEPWIEYFYGLESDGGLDGKFQVFLVVVEPDVFEWHNWVSLDDQETLAEEVGVSIEEYRLQARSEDPVVRTRVIENIAGRWGWYELDQYPLLLTESELRERWDCHG